MGPLLYVIFTNDVLQLVLKHSIAVNDPQPYCTSCCSTVCYVDDCTFSYGSRDLQQISDELNLQYKKIFEYMIAYQLVINDEKTQLVVVASRQTRDLVNPVRLQSENHPITQSSTAKLLGAVVSQDAKWRQHIMKHTQSLISQLLSRLISRKD